MGELERTCPTCGARIPLGAPFDLCPVCTLEASFQGGLEHPLQSLGYEVVGEIGRGGFSTVYECLQVEPVVRQLAIKVVDGDIGITPQRILEEAQLLSMLGHRGIPAMVDAGQLEDGQVFIAMPLLDGESLDRWLPKARPSMRERVALFASICGIVAHAHQTGICHRDLKPANIIISTNEGEPQAHVIDFGIASLRGEMQRIGREPTVNIQFWGTPNFMAPEQLALADTDHRTDVYALGALLYWLLNEKLPWPAVKAEQFEPGRLLQDREQLKLPPLSVQLPDKEGLYWLMVKCLSAAKELRYADAHELQADVESWLAGQPVQAAKHRWQYRAAKGLLRVRNAWPAIAAVLVFGAVVFGLLQWSDWRQDAREATYSEQVGDARSRQTEAQVLEKHEAALRLWQEGKLDKARALLEEALALKPEHFEAAFASRVMASLAPVAAELEPIRLPFTPKHVDAVDGHWRVTGYDGQTLLIDAETGEVVAESKPVAKPVDVLLSPDGLVRAEPGPGGHMHFLSVADDTHLLRPVQYTATQADTAIDWQARQLAATTDREQLRRWSLANIGRGKEVQQFASPAVWMIFERDAGNLWLRHADGMMRGWELGQAPGFAVDMPAFGNVLPVDVGENHSRGAKPGTEGMQLLWSLSQFMEGQDGATVANVAGARDEDIIAMTTTNGLLLHWDGMDGLHAESLDFTPEAVAIDHAGLKAFAIGQGQAVWYDLQTNAIMGQWALAWPDGVQVTSASILDGDSVAGEPRVVLGGDDGSVNVLTIRDREPELQRRSIVGSRPGKHVVRVHGMPGRQDFWAGVQGDVSLRRYDWQLATVGDGILLDNGLDYFFTSLNGRVLVVIDQVVGQPGWSKLRFVSAQTQRDVVPAMAHRSAILWANFSDSGRFLATSMADGTVRRWSFEEN